MCEVDAKTAIDRCQIAAYLAIAKLLISAFDGVTEERCSINSIDISTKHSDGVFVFIERIPTEEAKRLDHFVYFPPITGNVKDVQFENVATIFQNPEITKYFPVEIGDDAIRVAVKKWFMDEFIEHISKALLESGAVEEESKLQEAYKRYQVRLCTVKLQILA